MTLLDLAPYHDPAYAGFWTAPRLVLAVALGAALAAVAVTLIIRASRKKRK